MNSAQSSALEIIRAAGGTVRRTWLGGWRGGVRGLRVDVVESLVDLGVLEVATSTVSRKTRRSRGISCEERTYTIKAQ